MQADVILKEPPPWVPPISGSTRMEGPGLPPPRTPLNFSFKSVLNRFLLKIPFLHHLGIYHNLKNLNLCFLFFKIIKNVIFFLR